MRRRPRRRPPTAQEMFLGSAFLVLALSIAWGAIIGQSVSDIGARREAQPKLVTIHFPADGTTAPHPVDDRKPAAPAKAATAEAPADKGHVAPARGDRTWATALWEQSQSR